MHVWHLQWDTDADAAMIAAAAHVLSLEERRRADRIRVLPARCAAALSWGFLRRRLGRYLDRPPTELAFQLGPHGKPYLVAAANPDRLMFNLSHSGGHILLAVTRGREIGVDVEVVQPRRLLLEIAQRHYHPRELDELNRRSAGAQVPQFYRYWTLKEAWIKALGLGLHYPIRTLDFSAQVNSPGGAPFQAEGRGWWCRELAVHPDVKGAAVVARPAG